jgi:hypothetical protein
MTIQRSEDNLTNFCYDTFGVHVFQYNEKGQMVMFSADFGIFTYDREIYNPQITDLADISEYEYDLQGRLSKYKMRRVNVDGTIDQLVGETIYDYSTLKYTGKGYIWNGSEYELDEMGRVTYWKILTNEDKYGELDGKIYRLGDSYITYFKGGYSTLKGLGQNVWTRSSQYWDEDEQKGTMIFENSIDEGETWTQTAKNEVHYIYANSFDAPTSNETVKPPDTNIYGISNAVVVDTKDPAQVYIYNTIGQIVKQQPEGAGITRITLPKGLYFVTVNGKSYKVAVR